LKGFKHQGEYYDIHHIPVIEDELTEEQKKKMNERMVYNYLDLWLVLIHTHIFMNAYYGLLPTSSEYTKALNIEPAISGAI
jgi:hypothetical protein